MRYLWETNRIEMVVGVALMGGWLATPSAVRGDEVGVSPAPPVMQIGDTTPYDHVINLKDLNDVLNNFGGSGPQGFAWPKTSGIVDLDDLNNVLNNFGANPGHDAPSGLLLVAPEPGSAAVCGALALMGMGMRGRRRRA